MGIIFADHKTCSLDLVTFVLPVAALGGWGYLPIRAEVTPTLPASATRLLKYARKSPANGIFKEKQKWKLKY